MKILIKNNKIHYWSNDDEWVQEFEVNDNFFENLPLCIEKYTFEVQNWKLVWVENIPKEEKITQIKSETREKILSRYSETDQTNLQREAQLIVSECFLYSRAPTEEEQTILTDAKTAHEYIKTCIEEGKQRILELQ